MTDGPVAAPQLAVWDNPKSSEVGHDVAAFLRLLAGPTCITVAGELDAPPRVLTTLLHGNEPSGSVAIHRFLREGIRPRAPLVLVVASVEAALCEPRFSHRSLPEHRDLNRCFVEPWEGPDGARAHAIFERIRALHPESVIDLHNTSGRSPAYAVCTAVDEPHQALAALFTQHVIRTDLRLNTLMEATQPLAPTITVECGGAGEPEAHERAYHGLCRYARHERVLEREHDAEPISIMSHPLRVELTDDATVSYAREPDGKADVTLPPDMDRHNFGVMRGGVPIGRLGARGLAALRVMGAHGPEPTTDFFEARDAELVPVRDLAPLMATTNAEIAKTDCLFYLMVSGEG